jgi:hypothetical protein
MLNKKKTKYVWFAVIALILSFGTFSMIQMGSAHSPKFIDLKFFGADGPIENQNLSVYFVHGVSNTSYHYIETVEIEFWNLTDAFWTNLGDKPIDRIVEADVLDTDIVDEYLEDKVAFNKTYTEQHDDGIDTQDTLVIHHNYSIAEYNDDNNLTGTPNALNITYFTFIRVTAYCNLGGSFTNTVLAGQQWYDLEHSMIEAVVPTLVCSVVILTPLVIWIIIAKHKEKRAIKEGVSR